MSEQRVLAGEAYDTLEFSSLAFGGIGAHWLYENFDVPDSQKIPVCILGHADIAANLANRVEDRQTCPIHAALRPLFDGGDDLAIAIANNAAVNAINNRKRRSTGTRVTWKELTRELNIVRGD